MEAIPDPLRPEHADSPAPQLRRDGPTLRNISVRGAVWRDALPRQDGRDGALPRGVARPLAERPAGPACRATQADRRLVRALPRHGVDGEGRTGHPGSPRAP